MFCSQRIRRLEDQSGQRSSSQLPPKVGDFRERRQVVTGRSSHFGLRAAVPYLPGRRPGNKGQEF